MIALPASLEMWVAAVAPHVKGFDWLSASVMAEFSGAQLPR
jgi:hypothetical protein